MQIPGCVRGGGWELGILEGSNTQFAKEYKTTAGYVFEVACWATETTNTRASHRSRWVTQGWPITLQKLIANLCREIPRHQDLLFSLLISLRQRTRSRTKLLIACRGYHYLWVYTQICHNRIHDSVLRWCSHKSAAHSKQG